MPWDVHFSGIASADRAGLMLRKLANKLDRKGAVLFEGADGWRLLVSLNWQLDATALESFAASFAATHKCNWDRPLNESPQVGEPEWRH